MAYQALLFCPDEKTARAVTQVLGELEFAVEPCAETFAAVKKLMGAHFDAIVVDCDNEQNATLLFKSARNSSANQTSLAVAVVEGQAGVAKAFRIGANLVLTKPINIEQAKGTLRVARGLLRKSEAGKSGAAAASAASPAVAPSKPAGNKANPVGTPAPAAASAPRPVSAPTTKPTAAPPAHDAAWPGQPVAPSAPAPHRQEPAPKTTVSAASASSDHPISGKSVVPAQASGRLPAIPKPVAKPAGSASSFGSGAASAPAPAREAQAPPPYQSPADESGADKFGTDRSKTHELADQDSPLEHSPIQQSPPFESKRQASSLAPSPAGAANKAEAHLASPAIETPRFASSAPVPPPTFTFGGANAPAESGGGKKILLGVAAVALVGAALYLGWSYFTEHHTLPFSSPAPASQPVNSALTSAPPTAAPTPRPVAAAPVTSAATKGVPSAADPDDASSDFDDAVPAKSTSTSSGKTAAVKPAPAPLVVKGGAVRGLNAKSPAADTPAPSVIGIAAIGASAPPPDLGSTSAPKPVLQRMNVSQGVSQGLLIKKVSPTYPPAALQLRIEGTVQLLATISKTGDITEVKTISGDPQLSAAAAAAVKHWKYKPYLLSGEPVEIQTQITVNFTLPR
jgi:periplasmic protein TonB